MRRTEAVLRRALEESQNEKDIQCFPEDRSIGRWKWGRQNLAKPQTQKPEYTFPKVFDALSLSPSSTMSIRAQASANCECAANFKDFCFLLCNNIGMGFYIQINNSAQRHQYGRSMILKFEKTDICQRPFVHYAKESGKSGDPKKKIVGFAAILLKLNSALRKNLIALIRILVDSTKIKLINSDARRGCSSNTHNQRASVLFLALLLIQPENTNQIPIRTLDTRIKFPNPLDVPLNFHSSRNPPVPELLLHSSNRRLSPPVVVSSRSFPKQDVRIVYDETSVQEAYFYISKKRIEDADAIRIAEASWATKEKLLSLQDQLKYLGGCAKAGGPRIRNAVMILGRKLKEVFHINITPTSLWNYTPLKMEVQSSPMLAGNESPGKSRRSLAINSIKADLGENLDFGRAVGIGFSSRGIYNLKKKESKKFTPST
ncbi:hypothetical protein EAG_02063 [Camponotus floridanus]|uniref:Uncharacterized protein n=1 Tax=Camponotus floridanus TaxID=104421 RepID=E2B039_CAMFO|nr:hypothetical protein EAG_02063 [Camponotus floridanus]